MRKAAVLALAGAALLALALQAAALPTLPPLPVVPQVRVSLEAVAPVDVDRDLDAVVSTNGTVNVTIPPSYTGEIRVYFNVSINNTFWFATIDPPAASFVGTHEVPFRVNVTVPGRVATEPIPEIFVDANVSVAPGLGKSWTASTTIPIVQYFGVALTPSTSASPVDFNAEAGKDTGFALRIQNLGNGRDNFELHVDNIGDLQAQGISVFLPSPVQIAAKVTANVNGNVTIPAGLTTGNFTVVLSAFSTGAAAKGSTVNAVGNKEIHVVPPQDDQRGGPLGGGNNSTGKPFLPGPDAAMTVGAVGAAAALVAVRRLRRP